MEITEKDMKNMKVFQGSAQRCGTEGHSLVVIVVMG